MAATTTFLTCLAPPPLRVLHLQPQTNIVMLRAKHFSLSKTDFKNSSATSSPSSSLSHPGAASVFGGLFWESRLKRKRGTILGTMID